MFKSKIIFLFFIILLALPVSGLSAVFTGTPDSFIVTLNKVEMYNSSTLTWLTVGTGDLSFDIASANAGQSVGSYVSGVSFEPGTYTQVRVTVSRTMQIQGNIGANYTSSTASSADIGTGGQAIQAGSSPAKLGTMIVPTDTLSAGMTVSGSYFILTYDLGASAITITPGESKKITVKFDVANSLVLNDVPDPDIFYSEPPNVTYSVE